MPRLLLVDDNPSIHRIAESLLAPTDVELVCVASAAEALDRIGRGDRFDVALVDTAMPGMDGWTLLDRLRGMEATMRLPIALMAGVLDPVDPSKLAGASIQGFLKKPIELRELGDRVKALLATPVVIGPSPSATMPSTPSQDLLTPAQEALPELRPEPAEVPTGLLDIDLTLPEPEDDLLVLTAEDLWPEHPLPAAAEPVLAPPVEPDLHLELEELDLDNLQDLASGPLSEVQPEPELTVVSEVEVTAVPELESREVSEPEPAVMSEPEPAAPGEASLRALSEREELETVPADFLEPIDGPLPEPGLQEVVALPPGPGTPVPLAPVSSEQAQALLQALLAEPVLMDVLVKALVERLGDQVLREIAWEVMPDLAGRWQR
jgi:CheY-like chemotaxis protein